MTQFELDWLAGQPILRGMPKSNYREIMKRRAALHNPELEAIAKEAGCNYIVLLKSMCGIPVRTSAGERARATLEKKGLI